MRSYDRRNQHFDTLLSQDKLRWMGQNTNHVPAHPAVHEAMVKAIRDESYHAYGPPMGLEALRAGILSDLGLPDAAVLVTDGAIEGLSHVCATLLGPGDEFITTDPTWNWPMQFARARGATIRQIPIFGDENGWRLSPEKLAAAITPATKVVYLVDPNNPLGSCATAEEITAFTDIVRDAGAWLIHDCTYRDFAHDHHLAAKLLPERTVTIYSFSKWLGLAGLRLGAVVASPDLIGELAVAPPNNLGSNIVSQRAALAGLAVKDEWFPGVLDLTRSNMTLVREAAEKAGLRVPVWPSNGNFLVLETDALGLKPENLVAAYQAKGIQIRHGGYHTPKFGDRFIKVSLSVPREWAEEFADLLPAMIEVAKNRPAGADTY